MQKYNKLQYKQNNTNIKYFLFLKNIEKQNDKNIKKNMKI